MLVDNDTVRRQIMEMISTNVPPEQISDYATEHCCDNAANTKRCIMLIVAYFYTQSEFLRRELRSSKRFWFIWRIGQFVTKTLEKEADGEINRMETTMIITSQIESWRRDRLIG